LISGGDTELCYICLLLGYKIDVPASGLEFQHAIPSSRLSLDYISQFNYWGGYSSFIISSYEDLFIRNTTYLNFFPLWWLKRFLYLIKNSLQSLLGNSKAFNRSRNKGYVRAFFEKSYSVYEHTIKLRTFIQENKTR